MPSESNALPSGSLPSFQPYPPPQPTNPDSSSLSARPPHPFPIPSEKPVPSPLQHPAQSLSPLSLHQSAAVAPNRHSLSLPYPPSPPSSGNFPAPQAPPQNILTQAHVQAHSNLGTNNAPHPFLGSGLPFPPPPPPPRFSQPLELPQATPPAPSNLSCPRTLSSSSTSSPNQMLAPPSTYCSHLNHDSKFLTI